VAVAEPPVQSPTLFADMKPITLKDVPFHAV
jgi:hypothetical protein